jgi:hypothetical protein
MGHSSVAAKLKAACASPEKSKLNEAAHLLKYQN